MGDRRNTDRRISDRRRTERSAINCQIRLLNAATPSQILQGRLQDVSASGIRFVLTEAILPGDKLLVEARRGTRVTCNVTVQVIWIEPDSKSGFVVGCESLTELSPRQLTQLKSATAELAIAAAS